MFKFRIDNVFIIDSGSVADELPTAVYSVSHSPQTGYFLTNTNSGIAVPDKLYGGATKRSEMIWSTFTDRLERQVSTGVLLSGVGGTGKTVITKIISQKALDDGIPVILINDEFRGDSFNQFMTQLGKCVVIFDEFEKCYVNDEDQNSILSLFDGVVGQSKLFLLTVNGEVSEFLLNRPGRMYYNFQYNFLDSTDVREFLTDKLDPANHSSSIDRICALNDIKPFATFDVLLSIAEEIARYPADVIDNIIERLNVRIFGTSTFELTLHTKNDDDELVQIPNVSIISEFDIKNVFNGISIDDLIIYNKLYGSRLTEDKGFHFGKYYNLQFDVTQDGLVSSDPVVMDINQYLIDNVYVDSEKFRNIRDSRDDDELASKVDDDKKWQRNIPVFLKLSGISVKRKLL